MGIVVVVFSCVCCMVVEVGLRGWLVRFWVVKWCLVFEKVVGCFIGGVVGVCLRLEVGGVNRFLRKLFVVGLFLDGVVLLLLVDLVGDCILLVVLNDGFFDLC